MNNIILGHKINPEQVKQWAEFSQAAALQDRNTYVKLADAQVCIGYGLMEANRSEADRCLDIAKKHLGNGNVPTALKFLRKGLQLDPDSRTIKSLLQSLSQRANGRTPKTPPSDEQRHYTSNFDQYNTNESDLRNRFKSARSQPNFRAGKDDSSESSEEESENCANGNGDGGGAKGDRFSPSSSERQQANGSARPRERTTSNSSGKGRAPSHPRVQSQPQLGADYTVEELAQIKRIRGSKDYYEILSLKKDFAEAELKRSYRKLALQFHPDKCKAPGTSEAFKAIGNAYAVLSDAEKRRRYDMYGCENGPAAARAQHRHRHADFYEYDYSRGFEGDFTPEEIFNMFFGGGYPSGQVFARRANRAGGTFYFQRDADHDTQQHNAGGLGVALQLLPVLLLLVLSIASQFLVGDPAFSMHRTNRYPVERFTANLRVPYYVKSDFLKHYHGQLKRVEQQVEDEYIQQLRVNCYRERSQKETLAWRARTYGDSALWQRANQMTTPSCDRLNSIYA